MDGIHGSDARMHMVDAQQHQVHVQYVQGHDPHGLHHLSNGNGIGDEHDDPNGGSGGGRGTEDEDVACDPGNISDNHNAIVEHVSDTGDQLTLSFQGQVYVFDSVSPEKVIFIY